MYDIAYVALQLMSSDNCYTCIFSHPLCYRCFGAGGMFGELRPRGCLCCNRKTDK